MYLTTTILFFLYCFGLGTGLGFFVKESEDFLERNLMRIGLGLGSMLTLGLILNLVRVPLDWRIFLAVSIMLISSLVVKIFRKKPSFKDINGIKFSIPSLIMLLLFFITFYMYFTGAFSYPYLEDDDSWGHAIGVKYVAIEKSVFAHKLGIRYIDPYPPGYDMLFGILHQTNDSVYWTLKFFNALVISLSIIFFYYFAKVFTNSPKKAIFSTFALFAVPSYLSHFIWSIAITMPLFIVSFYALEKIKDGKMWWIAAAVLIAATLTTSPTHSAYFAAFLMVYLIVKSIVEKKLLLYHIIAPISGLAISLIVWWIPIFSFHGIKGALSGIGVNLNTSILDIAGTADRIYGIRDFFVAEKVNMINNPSGIGVVLSVLFIVAITAIIIRNYNNIKENKIKIAVLFAITLSITLFLLSRIYVKNVTKRGIIQIKPGDVPFSEFLSGQTFLITVLSIMIFILVTLIVASYKNHEFKNKYIPITIAWFIFSFFAVNAGPYYYKLSPFRAWIILALPASLLCGESINSINSIVKSIALAFTRSNKILAMLASLTVLGLIAYGVITTSFVQKYAVNTAIWGPGAFWTSNEEIQGYLWLKERVPAESKVFTFTNNAIIIGLDKFICHWCDEVREYKQIGFNQSAQDNYKWLKKEQYKYIIIDGQTVKRFGVNETNQKVQEFINSNRFQPIFKNNGAVIFGVV